MVESGLLFNHHGLRLLEGHKSTKLLLYIPRVRLPRVVDMFRICREKKKRWLARICVQTSEWQMIVWKARNRPDLGSYCFSAAGCGGGGVAQRALATQAARRRGCEAAIQHRGVTNWGSRIRKVWRKLITEQPSIPNNRRFWIGSNSSLNHNHISPHSCENSSRSSSGPIFPLAIVSCKPLSPTSRRRRTTTTTTTIHLFPAPPLALELPLTRVALPSPFTFSPQYLNIQGNSPIGIITMTNLRWLIAAAVLGLATLRTDAAPPVKEVASSSLSSVSSASSASSAPAPSSSSTASTLCQAYPANGTCAGYVTYPFALGSMSFAALEANISSLIVLKNLIGLSNPTCVDNFYRYACSFVYPKCGAASSAGPKNPSIFGIPESGLPPLLLIRSATSLFVPHPYFTRRSRSTGQVVYPACKSACKDVINTCTTTLTQLGQQAQLPNCATAVSPTIEKPLQDDGLCNYIAPEVVSTATTTNSTNVTSAGLDLKSLPVGYVLSTCPPPFVKDPAAQSGTNLTSSAQYCKFGCCIPCPAQNLFYKKDWLDFGFLSTNIVRAISTVTSGILLVSYLVLPEKRKHPSVLILMSSFAIFLLSAVVFFVVGNPKRIQCASEFLPSTQSNNLLCTIQGAWLIFSSFATAMWICALIINLHVHTVWNSNLLVNRYILIHLLCWGIPAGITATAVVLQEIKWEFASLCLVSVDQIFNLFFYPLAIIICPSFLIHMATFFHIARISMKEGIESEMTQSRSFTSQSIAPPRISHRRHVITAVRIQWRALLMAVIAVVTVVFYWLFYFTQVTKLTTLRDQPELILAWIACMMTTGQTQDTCHDAISPYLPPYPVMIAAETAVSLVGLWLFVIFAKRSIWVEWSDWWYEVRQNMKTKGEKSEDQFLAL
ncbi:hypothetical protein BC938DRAFT_473822 [Jimgerdemannia flammicorona]|uniref:G-protein coupled receptors family 2 profile 2 domain-containing protein n=1 Tax=Jimgerdemannia flammicorona TaxID=994334 RepID=A0A433QT21_9FUNG|nr:hypothetical protein BC938DRAFT_473822 [Jimgerdemannia flammicorona]